MPLAYPLFILPSLVSGQKSLKRASLPYVSHLHISYQHKELLG